MSTLERNPGNLNEGNDRQEKEEAELRRVIERLESEHSPLAETLQGLDASQKNDLHYLLNGQTYGPGAFLSLEDEQATLVQESLTQWLDASTPEAKKETGKKVLEALG